MIFFNLAWIGVSMGDAQAAATYYTKCESLPDANSRELAELKSLIDVLQFREGIKKAIGK